MNGLTLRISANRFKNNMGSPVNLGPAVVPEELFTKLSENEEFKTILESTAAGQLAYLRSFKYRQNEMSKKEFIEFFVILFLNTEAKHPVHCLIASYITRNPKLHQLYEETIAEYLTKDLLQNHDTYKNYINGVSQIGSCAENVVGTKALLSLDVKVMNFLRNSLLCCVNTLRNENVSPTEKNDIYSLIHSVLRVIHLLVQKMSKKSRANLSSINEDIGLTIKQLLVMEDVPMDTKSLCGILFITTYINDNGADSWLDALGKGIKDKSLQGVLEDDSSKLSILSAIATIVPPEKLYSKLIDEELPITQLTQEILIIGERTSSEPIFVLGVARTLAQISKTLSASSRGHLIIDVLLTFVWNHLEHYMDSVGHLAGQILSNVVRYGSKMKNQGDEIAINKLFSALECLDRGRKSFYLLLTALTKEMGAKGVMEYLPDIVEEVMDALKIQAVQASATMSLETLLRKQVQESSGVVPNSWLALVLHFVTERSPDCAMLAVLENLLTLAVSLDENVLHCIMDHIKETCECENLTSDKLKRVLILMKVARKSGGIKYTPFEDKWEAFIGYDVLKMAAVDAIEENRILLISLIVESPKTTEPFSEEELNLVLWYFQYNCNAQSPSFRQLTLSIIRKFIHRINDSYITITRLEGAEKSDSEYYFRYIEKFREYCYGNLIPGANYSRRYVTLQTLAWIEEIIDIEGYNRTWKESYIEKLLLHLEDSYENNKALALQILNKCPEELLQKPYPTSLEFSAVVKQASSVKPTASVSAAYKLQLLLARLPRHVPALPHPPRRQPIRLFALRALVEEGQRQLKRVQECILSAALDAPLHGVLLCIRRVMSFDRLAIQEYEQWTALFDDIISLCMAVTKAVGCVVNSASPEGHLPMDNSPLTVDRAGHAQLGDGRHVTAQVVLLCAWRAVKEVSLILGYITSELSIEGVTEYMKGSISRAQIKQIGEHFKDLLAEIKHRGAFEQAYVGFTMMLSRLWRSRDREIQELLRSWQKEVLTAVQMADEDEMAATRRSAGLPFMIQALLTAELQSAHDGRGPQQVLQQLVRTARTGSLSGRCHALNILRACVRCAPLRPALAPLVGDALTVALQGFDGNTWMERNSSTLLFSALIVWIFGVQRSKDSENLCTRNRMTGRIFFLRYPQLYDFLLLKLEQASECVEGQLVLPSLFPALLLLARLYPSSLEGTVSNFKVWSFVRVVLGAGRGALVSSRRLAARALHPLLPPDTYYSLMLELMGLLTDHRIQRNHCHGILLQIIKLLENEPDNLELDKGTQQEISDKLQATSWILQQACADVPCYIIANDYIKMINILVWKFPILTSEHFKKTIKTLLENLLFKIKTQRHHPGHALCLANAAYLHLLLLNKYNQFEDIRLFVHKYLAHDSYEVVLSALNYILILHDKLELENNFQRHLISINNKSIWELLKDDITMNLLTDVLNIKYLECKQKALEILTLGNETERYIINDRHLESDDDVIEKLMYLVENEHERFTYNYLQSLSNIVTRKIKGRTLRGDKLLQVMKLIQLCSSSDNSDETRCVVVEFVERNFEMLLDYDLNGLANSELFELKSTVWATLVILIEDDNEDFRQRISDVVTAQAGAPRVLGSRGGALLRGLLLKGRGPAGPQQGPALLAVLALLEFRSLVRLTDELADESQVFDQNEKYNVHLEETIWTKECVEMIKSVHTGDVSTLIRNITRDLTYRPTFQHLCGDNFRLYEDMVDGKSNSDSELANPKVAFFVNAIGHS